MRPLGWIFVALTALSIAGCGSFGTPQKALTRNFDSYALPVWTSDGMYLVSGRSGALFLTPTPLELSQYRGVRVESIQITTDKRSRDLTAAERRRLEHYFTRRLKHVFERNGMQVLDAPGDDVLQARLAVRDLKLEDVRRKHQGAVVARASSDLISIALELRDAKEDDRRLLFGDKRRLPFGTYAGTDAISIRRVEDAFYYFSIDMRRRLREVKRGDFPPPPPPPQVSG